MTVNSAGIRVALPARARGPEEKSISHGSHVGGVPEVVAAWLDTRWPDGAASIFKVISDKDFT